MSKNLHGGGAEGEGLEAGAVDGGGRGGPQQRLDLRLEQLAQRAVEGGPQDLQRVIEEPAQTTKRRSRGHSGMPAHRGQGRRALRHDGIELRRP